MWLLIWVELSCQTKVFYISKYQIKKYIVIVYKYIAQYRKKIHKNRAKAKKQSTVYYISKKKKSYVAQYKRKYTKIEHKLKNKA